METTRHVSNLANLAKTYTARAQPVPGTATAGADDIEPIEVEVRILTTVHDAVRLRAADQQQVVANVARAILFQAAAKVTPRQIAAYTAQRNKHIEAAGERARTRAIRRSRRRLAAEGLKGSELEAAVRSDPAVETAVIRAKEQATRSRLPLRDYVGTDKRHRLRFTAPAKPYRDASTAILASGRTVVRVVEDGLREYAKTGQL